MKDWKEWLDFIRGLQRPALVFVFVVTFVYVLLSSGLKYFDSEIAKLLWMTFSNTMSLIIGVIIGRRTAVQ